MSPYIHPFPARMAPELALNALRSLPPGKSILDPMSGSGTALKHASMLGHTAFGCDMDPLAVLVANVWTKKIDVSIAEKAGRAVAATAASLDPRRIELPWIDNDAETRNFVHYWFGRSQRQELRCISAVLANPKRYLKAQFPSECLDALKVALSRIIITKEQKASLARDTSHSRPHKVSNCSNYSVFRGFEKSVGQVIKKLDAGNDHGPASIEIGDARSLQFPSKRFDYVITSPPYLNAIDYMRGHKFTLVWLGHSIPSLRKIRTASVGAEKAPERQDGPSGNSIGEILSQAGNLEKLPGRYAAMIERYAIDMEKSLAEASRVLRHDGAATYVVGNSCLKGVYIRNSNIVLAAAKMSGLRLLRSYDRELPQNHRYLPIDSNSALSRRMRIETILNFKKA